MAFNLDDYQTVAERLDQAIKDHPDLRIITSLEHVERIDGRPVHYIFKAEMWLGTILLATGWADEIVGSSHITKTNGLEVCETSAIGRCLANAGYQGKKDASDNPSKTRPTREEMQKAERYQKTEREQIKAANPLDWGDPIPEPPADDPFANWSPINALGAEVIETKPNSPKEGYGHVTPKQEGFIRRLFAEKYPDGDLQAFVREQTGEQIEHLSELSKRSGSKLIEVLKG
jgi:hypothetical protein